jgi:hypothetical protein
MTIDKSVVEGGERISLFMAPEGGVAVIFTPITEQQDRNW